MPKKNTKKEQAEQPVARPWMPFKTGLIAVGIVSVSLTIWMLVNSNPEIALLERVFWAVVFGASIWPIFFFFLFLNRLFRRGK